MEVNEIIDILTHRKEDIFPKLAQNYSFQYLSKLFHDMSNISSSNISSISSSIATNVHSNENVLLNVAHNIDNILDVETIEIKDDTHSEKRVYKFLTGLFENSQYTMSAIDWLPSAELVNNIVTLANQFNITYIDEICSGIGILSYLIKEHVKEHFKDSNINITTADTFEYVNTCNKLDMVPIAKRGISDYQYYPLLGEPYPQMVISTYYPDNSNSKNCNLLFINEISNMIKSTHHQIIIIIVPNTFVDLNNPLYYLSIDSSYIVKSYHIKAVDKYFELYHLLNTYYKSSMMCHILIKKNSKIDDAIITNDRASENRASENRASENRASENDLISEKINEIFKDSTIPNMTNNGINSDYDLIGMLKLIYELSSPKLVKDVYQNYDLMKPISLNAKVTKIMNEYTLLKKYGLVLYPQWIYTVDEFLFWTKCIRNDLFFIFTNRVNFYNFYTKSIGVENSEFRQSFGFPTWVRNIFQMYKYIYLDIIQYPKNWKTNSRVFEDAFRNLNHKNRSLLFKNN